MQLFLNTHKYFSNVSSPKIQAKDFPKVVVVALAIFSVIDTLWGYRLIYQSLRQLKAKYLDPKHTINPFEMSDAEIKSLVESLGGLKEAELKLRIDFESLPGTDNQEKFDFLVEKLRKAAFAYELPDLGQKESGLYNFPKQWQGPFLLALDVWFSFLPVVPDLIRALATHHIAGKRWLVQNTVLRFVIKRLVAIGLASTLNTPFIKERLELILKSQLYKDLVDLNKKIPWTVIEIIALGALAFVTIGCSYKRYLASETEKFFVDFPPTNGSNFTKGVPPIHKESHILPKYLTDFAQLPQDCNENTLFLPSNEKKLIATYAWLSKIEYVLGRRDIPLFFDENFSKLQPYANWEYEKKHKWQKEVESLVKKISDASCPIVVFDSSVWDSFYGSDECFRSCFFKLIAMCQEASPNVKFIFMLASEQVSDEDLGKTFLFDGKLGLRRYQGLSVSPKNRISCYRKLMEKYYDLSGICYFSKCTPENKEAYWKEVYDVLSEGNGVISGIVEVEKCFQKEFYSFKSQFDDSLYSSENRVHKNLEKIVYLKKIDNLQKKKQSKMALDILHEYRQISINKSSFYQDNSICQGVFREKLSRFLLSTELEQRLLMSSSVSLFKGFTYSINSLDFLDHLKIQKENIQKRFNFFSNIYHTICT